ncbi:SRPBCC family protein [Saccharothrix obliqua]|uniref:SRPBCC family protein n=1 Tax=Saccharothrix obliqua TaxID=2861747 RepID=UPI001C5F3A40|nr:SRPBCC family protein [Saccharothrix obliqua]MBW4720495.1 SRPBCC family protein [Saccharothrix obliqua]
MPARAHDRARTGPGHAATTSAPADPDAVFSVLTDLDALPSWLPPGLDVAHAAPGRLRLWVAHGHLARVVDRRVSVDRDARRLVWGVDGEWCSGEVRVRPAGAGRSTVTARLAGPSAVAGVHPREWLEEALAGLVTAVEIERHVVAWWAGTVLT